MSNVSDRKFEFQIQQIQGNIAGGKFGTPVVAGDFNCDGLSDIAVGLQSANGEMGEVQIFFSNGVNFNTTPQRIKGTRTNGRFGIYLKALDYDGRTFSVGGVQRKCSDLAVAAFNRKKQEPRVYLYFGRPAFIARTDEGISTGAELIYTAPSAQDTFADILGALDLDGDGLGDLAMSYKASTDTNRHILVDYGEKTVPLMASGNSPLTRSMPLAAEIDITGNDVTLFGRPLANAGSLNATTSKTQSLLIGSAFEINSAGGKGRVAVS